MSTLLTSLPDCNNRLFLTRQSLPRRPSYSTPATFSVAYPCQSFAIRSSTGDQRPSNSQHLIPTLATSAALIFFNLGGFPSFAAASVRLPPAVAVAEEDIVVNNQSTEGDAHEEEYENEEAKAAFERYKSKTYALTVPLRIVALRNSVPPLWIKNFVQSQGKRVKFRLEFRGNLEKMFSELSTAIGNGKLTSKSVGAADIISLGDTWVNFAISQMLIEPIQGVEDQDWFHKLSDKWKVYLHRNNEGKLDTGGKIWAVPYRWGSMVIAYRKNKFRQHNLAPVEDWADLWRSDLAGRISMVDSPREVIGAVLKYMGASYNTSDIDSQVVGGRNAVQSELAALKKQVRLFDSANYLKAFSVGDVWVAVGWSSDIIPAAKRMSDVAVIVPKSGASLWADLWAIPAASRVETGRVGGRVRGPSPLVHQWMEFCLQSQRALPFEEEVVAGASPAALSGGPPARKPENVGPNKPKLDTNLVSGVPPPDILSRCEFLEPLSDSASLDYQWLVASMQSPNRGLIRKLQLYASSLSGTFRSKLS